MRLRLDIIECELTGRVVDYVLVNENGYVIARLGPDGATQREKDDLLDDLGLRSPWGCTGGSAVVFHVESSGNP